MIIIFFYFTLKEMKLYNMMNYKVRVGAGSSSD